MKTIKSCHVINRSQLKAIFKDKCGIDINGTVISSMVELIAASINAVVYLNANSVIVTEKGVLDLVTSRELLRLASLG